MSKVSINEKKEYNDEFFIAYSFFRSHSENVPSPIKESLEYLSDILILSEKPKLKPFFYKIDSFDDALKHLPKHLLCYIYITGVKECFPDTNLNPSKFEAFFDLELQSQTFKRWNSQTFCLNYFGKTLKFDQKEVVLSNYAVRWIGNYKSNKWVFALDSFDPRQKSFIIGSSFQEKATVFFENLKHTINNVDYSPLFQWTNDSLLKRPPLLKHCKSSLNSSPNTKISKNNRISCSSTQNYIKKTSLSLKVSPSLEEVNKNIEEFEKAENFELYFEEQEFIDKSEEKKTNVAANENKVCEFVINSPEKKMEQKQENSIDFLIKSPAKKTINYENFIKNKYEDSLPTMFLDLLPKLEQENISNLFDFNLIETYGSFSIYQNLKNFFLYKLFGEFPFNFDKIIDFFINPNQNDLKKLMGEDIEIYKRLKMISSETSVIYERRKKFGYLYLPREYVYMRTVIKEKSEFCMILEKSVKQHDFTSSFFRKMEGEIKFSMILLENLTENRTKLTIIQEIDHGGYLTLNQNKVFSLSRLHNFYKYENYFKEKIQLQEEIEKKESLLLPSVKDVLIDLKRKSSNTTQKSYNNESPPLEMIENETKIFKPPLKLKLENFDEMESDRQNRFLQLSMNPKEEKRYHSYDINLPLNKSVSQKASEITEENKISLQDIRSQNHLSLQSIRNIKVYEYRKPLFEKTMKIDEENGHYILKKDWKKSESCEGLIYLNKEVLKTQKNMLSYLIKRLGSSIIQGKPISSIAFPIDLYEPISELEKIVRDLSLAPYFIEKASEVQDPIEQMKWIVAAEITNLHMNITQKKPFVSGKGETHIAEINGSPIYLEQIKSDPPLAYFLLYGDKYKFYGYSDVEANLNANSVVCRNRGKFFYEFKGNKNKIISFHPIVMISGTAFGQRTFNHEGKMYIFSEKDSIIAEITFNPDKKSLLKGLFSRKGDQRAGDSFVGQIFTVESSYFQNILNENPLNLSGIPPQNIIKIHSKIEGIWHEELKIDDVLFWKMNQIHAFEVEKLNLGRLPSDSLFREDIALWRLGDQKAQIEMEKFTLEEKKNEELRKKKKKKHK